MKDELTTDNNRTLALTSAAINADEADYWLNKTRTGGAYIPPARLAQMQRNITDQSSEAYQRLCWEALKKSLNGLVNKVNTSNIKHVVIELFGENLVRGKGLFVKSIMKAQAAALPFTAVYAATVSIINSKMPIIGELLLTRIICQFRKAFKRNDKPTCIAIAMFIGHLANHHVVHEILVLQLLMLLLENPTDDSVEIAVGLMRECGHFLADTSPRPCNAVFERFRAILHEGSIDKRIQYMIEVLFQVRKEGFKDYLAIKTELDLVDEEDQITHYITLDDELDPQESLNVFKYDPNFIENEIKFEAIKKEILGEDTHEEQVEEVVETEVQEVIDETGVDMTSLRKTIYLTLMSAIDVEECCHKLCKLQLPEGKEIELCNMIVECCSQERTYLKYYGLLAGRFCQLNQVWETMFSTCFSNVYEAVHKIDTQRIRNITKLFGHLLETDCISWTVLECIRLTEDDTTAASRIFIKFLLQELAEFFSQKTLKERFEDQDFNFEGLFPRDTLRNIRFTINFYEAIDLPLLSEKQRQFLSNLEAEIMAETSNEQYKPEAINHSVHTKQYHAEHSTYIKQ